jgi:hypothetical protein
MNDTVTSSTAATPAPVADTQPSTLNPPPASSLFPQAKGESDRAAEAFRAYLELGPKRRYAAVAKTVSTSLRTVRRWANDFDWRGRIKTYAAQSAEQFAETENTLHREDLLDAAARVKAFRDRQYTLAEAMLDTAERYLERVDDDDLDLMSFADACKALEVASRIGQQAATSVTDDPAASSRGLRDQIEALLDQVYGETSSPTNATGQPKPATSKQAQL